MGEAGRRRGGRPSSAGVPSRLSKQGPPVPKPRAPSISGFLINRKVLIVGALLILLLGVATQLTLNSPSSKKSKCPNLIPYPSPKILDLDQFKGDHQDAYLWGTYRPGYYFGMRARHPKSLVTGIMWVDFTRRDWFTAIRHEALHADDLQAYNWLEHDGETFGIQQLEDDKFNVTTSFVKQRCADCGVGGDWAVRVQVQPSTLFLPGNAVTEPGREQQQRPVISLFYYVAAEGMEALEFDLEAWKKAVVASGKEEQTAVLRGKSEPFGQFALRVSTTGAQDFPIGAHWMGLRTPHTANLTEAVKQGLRRSLFAQRSAGADQYVLRLSDDAEPGSNVYVLQVLAWLPAELEIEFASGKGVNDKRACKARFESMSGPSFHRMLAERSAAFRARFSAAFSPSPSAPTGADMVSRAALGGLLGGIGYWYGHSMVWVINNWPPVLPNWDAALFSASPSRPQFPRGFLWDEGFHQLLIRRWKPDLSRDILAHWLDLMASTGWIAREQILGEEARLRVPAEFVPQPTKAANPPSLFLVLNDMADSLGSKHTLASERLKDLQFLERAWPRLLAWYRWLNTTQAGQLPGSFRWRERDATVRRELNPRTLASGLDDYPRASHPTDGERHLDLRCWMALSSSAMARIGRAIYVSSDSKKTKKHVQIEVLESLERDALAYSNYTTLKELHYDENTRRFSDWGLHSEGLRLGWLEQEGNEMVRVEEEAPTYRFVAHQGYVSLFPLILRLIPPNDPQLGREISYLLDPTTLLSPAGIRSLSMKSSIYGKHNTEHDPPYWRGAVWININHLIIDALKWYGKQPGPYQGQAAAAESRLRDIVLSNIVEQFRRTGFLWEQYSDTTGEGKGAHPFTGWTSLVALIAAGESHS